MAGLGIYYSVCWCCLVLCRVVHWEAIPDHLLPYSVMSLSWHVATHHTDIYPLLIDKHTHIHTHLQIYIYPPLCRRHVTTSLVTMVIVPLTIITITTINGIQLVVMVIPQLMKGWH